MRAGVMHGSLQYILFVRRIDWRLQYLKTPKSINHMHCYLTPWEISTT